MFFTFSTDLFLTVSSAFLVLLRIKRNCCHEFSFNNDNNRIFKKEVKNVLFYLLFLLFPITCLFESFIYNLENKQMYLVQVWHSSLCLKSQSHDPSSSMPRVGWIILIMTWGMHSILGH